MTVDRRRSGATLVGLLRHARYEVIPTAGVAENVLAYVPLELTVTVTASPAKGLEATLELTELLRAAGYRVVTHLSARLVRDGAHLREIVDRLRAVGVDDVFVPAGDADPPAGRFDAALPLLVELTHLGGPFPSVGIPGYPESHPRIDDDVTVQAMWDKRGYATYIVSNLCFDARVLATWVARVRRRQVTLPIHLGVAGPVESTKLLAIATKIGVGESTRFLRTHPLWLTNLIRPGGYSPVRLLHRVSNLLTAPDSGVAGLHVYTFNQLAETERWRQRMLEGQPR
ncbi:MAG: methylenetetrahydrofolate reductase [Pseudonocardiales bacterium]|nr:methylenetetrahydrofolate reductase [Pseudonocardiales bacterium]